LAQSILDLWFGPLKPDGTVTQEYSDRWFELDPTFDATIRRRFLETLELAGMGALDRWTSNDATRTALLVLLDQFPRHLFRDQARAFYYDRKALSFSLQALDTNRHLEMPGAYAYFTVMPTMHSEDLLIQERCVLEFTRLAERHQEGAMRELLEAGLYWAKKHRDTIRLFGRFPQRNVALGRVHTPDEEAYLSAQA
jgi:uncharacterized protein (DUF924 family)